MAYHRVEPAKEKNHANIEEKAAASSQ